MISTTDWMPQEYTTVRQLNAFSPLFVPPGGVKKYFWNHKCLEAPKPLMRPGGLYYWREPFVVRKVVPGLIEMSEPIQSLPAQKITLEFVKNWLKTNRGFRT